MLHRNLCIYISLSLSVFFLSSAILSRNNNGDDDSYRLGALPRGGRAPENLGCAFNARTARLMISDIIFFLEHAHAPHPPSSPLTPQKSVHFSLFLSRGLNYRPGSPRHGCIDLYYSGTRALRDEIYVLLGL